MYSDDYFFVRLLDYKQVPRNVRAVTIADIIRKHGNDILAIEAKHKNVNISRLVEFNVMKDMLFQYSMGWIPFEVRYLTSFDNFRTYFQLKHFTNWTHDAELMEDKAKNGTLPVFDHGEINHGDFADFHSTDAANYGGKADHDRRVMQATPGAKGPKIVPAVVTTTFKDKDDDPYVEAEDIITTWRLPDGVSAVYSLIAICLRVAVIVLQFFIIFIRPCMVRRHTLLFDWTMYFASTMVWIQLFLLMGLLTRNFGYAMNHPLDEMLKMSRSNLIESIDNEFIRRVLKPSNKFRGSGLWKLAVAHYTPSPFVEDWLPLSLLILAILINILVKKTSPGNPAMSRDRRTATMYEMAREFRTGVAVGSMVPLVTTAMNTIFSMIRYRMIFSLSGAFNFIVSILIMVYYIFFAARLFRPLEVRQDEKQRYYNQLNYDFPRIVALKYEPYIEYVIQFAITIAQFALNKWNRICILVVLVLQIFLMVKLMLTKMNKNISLFPKILKINFWKQVNLGIRTLILVLFFVFSWFNKKLSLPILSGLTMLGLILILVNVFGYGTVLYYRISGLRRRGIDDLYPNATDPGRYIEMENDGRSAVIANAYPTSYAGSRRGEQHYQAGIDFRSQRADKTKRRKPRVSFPYERDEDDDYGLPERSRATPGRRSRVSRRSRFTNYSGDYGDFGYNYIRDSTGTGGSRMKFSRRF